MSVRNSEMTIKLSADNSDASVSICGPDGVTREKCISVEDLTANLARRNVMTTGLLPSNCRMFKGDRNNYTIVLESPAKVRRFQLYVSQRAYEEGENNYSPENLMVPFPYTLFFFSVNNRRVCNTMVYSLDRKLGTEEDALFYFPYGNVYDNGRVCWGRVELPEIGSPMALAGLVGLFFDAPFNGDLTNGRIFTPPNDNVNDFWALVRYMAEQSTFPSDVLRRAGTTFRNVLQNISGR